MLYFARWKIITILVVIAGAFLAALPNLFDTATVERFPSFLPSQKMNLGLDLRGGSQLLMEVDSAAVIRDRLTAVRDDMRSTLRPGGDRNIGYRNLTIQDQAVSVQITDPAKVGEAVDRLRELAAPISGGILGTTGARDLEVEAGEGGHVTVRLTDAAVEQRVRSAVAQSIEILRGRIDQLGTTEPSIQRQGSDRILVQVPGLDDPERLKALIGTTAKLTFRLVDMTATQDAVPASSEVVPDAHDPTQRYVLQRKVMVSGEDLVDAQPGFDQQTNEPIVTFRFDTSGARRFGQVTQENVGRPFAIVLDDKVISAPVIREPILGGTGQISGNFTVQEANDLAILLRAGALPAPLTILEERTVGPGLGADSIAAGEVASVIGSVAVIAFMILTYGLFGVFADLALIVNVVLIIAVLSILQATLTLPGIAGIVLTVGMAVDSNVLIYERIREEIRLGRSPISALESGFSKAYATILDSNITTFIAAAVLFMMGSGPVRGFAVTLGLGILTSMFTAFTVTRLIVSLWLRRRRRAVIPI